MFKFKKIASVLAGALMIGSTMGLANAANYPDPFVKSGQPNVAIVYGSHPAASVDLAAALQIQGNLEAQVITDSTGGDTTVTGGDFVKLERASTKFQLGKGISDVISTTVTDDDLEMLLADGIYLDNDNDEFDYTQKIVLANLTLSMFDDNDYKEDTPTVGFSVATAAHVLNYTLDMTDEPLWADLSSTDINLMGKDYYILSVTTNTTLNLLDSGVSNFINEGETNTILVGDKSYEVSAQIYGTNQVVLTVNGVKTNSLDEGQTYNLGDNTYVGIKDILYVSKETGISSVEFSIGSGKLTLVHGSDVKINEDTINNLGVFMTNSAEKLQELTIEWKADDDMFITEDSSITIPGFENIKLSFGGMTFPSEENIAVSPSSDYIQLNDFPLKDSTEDINLLYGSTAGQYAGIGKSATNILRTSNSSSITFDGDTDDYFVASYDDGTNAESYLMRATSFVTENSVNKTTIQYKKDGTWTDKKSNAQVDDQITIGNVVLTVGAIDKNAKTVAITAGTNVNFNRLYSKEGLKVWLPWPHNGANSTTLRGAFVTNASALPLVNHNTSYQLQFEEEDKNENLAGGLDFNTTLAWTSGTTPETHVSDVVGESVTFAEIGDTDVFRSFMYSALATELLWDKSGDQYSFKAMYHGQESYGDVFLTDVSATVGGSGSLTVGVPILDTEVSSVSGKSLVVVGGSCVNTVAAQLLGSSTPLCGEAFTARTNVGSGQFLIQTFPRTGSAVATLVAGYNAGDTTNAARYLTTDTNAIDTTSGKKYVGTSATSAELVVA